MSRGGVEMGMGGGGDGQGRGRGRDGLEVGGDSSVLQCSPTSIDLYTCIFIRLLVHVVIK